MNNDNLKKFSDNWGKNAPFWKALKEWNSSRHLKSWCVPQRGTKEHEEVMEVMRKQQGKLSNKKTSTDDAANKDATVIQKMVRNKQKPVAKPTETSGRPKRVTKQVIPYNPRTGKGIKMITKKKK
jgi:hypothetical protein